ncbi:MAG: type I-A CRISPR-associated protein Cas4/Csa1 [Candidatus Caldarchaeum sp.]|nr:type I-A CRISPR-associated protein Cas4/Csa1 [Candidatus Caldarchaeum sp.]MDW8436324.1 type I-A CRISPR-associated protein Cas4/Csa1 [Candidatus Caldarchaeum sp.]
MPCHVSDELRGWRWREPPLLNPYRVRVNASDLSFDCGSGRFSFLRHVLRVRESAGSDLLFGVFVHRVVVAATTAAKSILYGRRPSSGRMFFDEMMALGRVLVKEDGFSRFPDVFDSLWSRAAHAYSSALDKVLSVSRYLSWDGVVYRVVPWICEFPLDGRPLGLHRAVRVDALIPPSVIVEFKTRRPSRLFEVALAGYALCFEAQFRVPVDHAVLVYLSFDRDGVCRVYENFVAVDDALRMEFVERRDLLLRVAAERFDPGLPPECDRYCPYLKYCRASE